jgi:hypothetical protein
MKIVKPVFVFSLSFIFLICLTAAKYAPNFKTDKKQIDSLAIIMPTVIVHQTGQGSTIIDSSLSNTNKKLIHRITKRMMKARYEIENISAPNLENFDFYNLYEKLDSSDNTLQDIACADPLSQVGGSINNRYVLFISYEALYNPNFDTDYNFKQGLKTNTLIFDKSTKPFTECRLLVIDTKTKLVVYYDKISTSNYDPRVESEVEDLTKKILKNMYYK